VRIINQPFKVGWYGGELYLEVHPPLEEDEAGWAALQEGVMAAVDAELFRRPVDLDMAVIEQAISEPNGMPVVISRGP
jgi:L,D-transpeptidase ErfK/SrfK